MVINYTLKNYQFRETTKGKGIVKYLLVDEQGKTRVVSAIASLGFGNKIKSVRPIHHRETPLTDILFKADINEKITVDFTGYNSINPRGAAVEERKIGTVRTDKVTDAYQESLISDLESITHHKGRFIKLILTSVLVVVAMMFVLSSFSQ